MYTIPFKQTTNFTPVNGFFIPVIKFLPHITQRYP